MRSWLLILTLVVLCSGCEKNDSVRMLCYNIKAGRGMDGALSLERTSRVIRQYKPDIVLLQEVDQNTGRSGNVNQPFDLMLHTGMDHVHFAPAIEHDGGLYGLAVMYNHRFHLVDDNTWRVPATEGWEPRIVQELTFSPKGSDVHFTVMNTHLDYHNDDRDRMAGVAVITERMQAIPERPIIIGGDFNARPESRVIETMRRDWTLLTPLDPTAPADVPTATIDYIFAQNLPEGSVTEAFVVNEPMASDHRPVFVEIKLSKAAR